MPASLLPRTLAAPLADLTLALTHALYGMGFWNVRPLGLADDHAGPASPGVVARASSGRVDTFAITTRSALDAGEEVQRLSALAAEALRSGSTFWIAVPSGDRDSAEALLHERSVEARLIGL